MTGTYDPSLVTLSYKIAAIASYTALDLTGRVRQTRGWPRAVWLMAAAVAMGGGIWSMHFVGMLAFVMPMPVSYDFGTTVISLLLPILVTGLGFFLVSRDRASLPVLLISGLFMGLGIVSMHYIGMAAMRMPATTEYDPVLVGVSVLIAIGAAFAALWLAYRIRAAWQRLASALVMGLAVAGMHYTAMAAARFVMTDPLVSPSDLVFQPGLLAIAVASTTFLVLMLALVSSAVDQRIAAANAREAEALRRSERLFRSLIQNAPDIIAVLDREGRFVYGSDAVRRDLGYRPEDLIGRNLVDYTRDADKADAKAFLDDTLTQPGRPVMRTLCLRHADGSWHDFEAVGTDLLSEPGINGVVLNLRDVTERKRLEEQLRHAQKIEAVGQLTGGVAHDFNNLLTVIAGNLELLQRRVEDKGLRRFLHQAVAAAFRGRSLTRQLLAFSRQQRLEPEALDLNRIVADTVAVLRRTLGDAITIETRLADGLWTCLADPGQVETALLNLAVNARDAMPEGGTLTFETANADCAAGCGRNTQIEPGDYVALSVRDTGAGMPPEVIERAFDPFFTTKAIGKGTGLGLSMVFGFAKQSSGHVEIDSAVGRGTTMRLYLPRLLAAMPRATAAWQPETTCCGAGETVLVVEDDPDVRQYAVDVLRDLGYRAIAAGEADEALRMLRENPEIDLLFSDVMMPGMTGPELAEAARRERPSLPVLLASGYAKDGANTANAFIAKPYERAALAAKVRSLLARRDARPAGAPRRILIVEDEFLVALLIKETLTALGVEVCGTAASAPEAVALAETCRPDLALVDVGLARGTNGVAAAQEMMQRLGTPVVFLTGHGSDVVTKAGVAASGYVSKPFTPEELTTAVRRGLGI